MAGCSESGEFDENTCKCSLII
ncbi:hypothetical protein EYY58_22450 [Acinetobacter bereziniae]|nr:hypothetical protein EYY58_22450 [Acinetobacter bereziniae]